MERVNHAANEGLNPKISVIVPAYNAEATLARCLDSVLAQTYGNFEILAVDDGSADGTAAILRDYTAKDARIKALFREHKGAAAARFAGLSEASGEWITFLDADDAMEEDLLAVLLNLALGHEVDIALCGFRIEWENGESRLFHGTGETGVFDRDEGLRALLRGDFEPSLWAKLYRRELFDAIPADFDLTVRFNEDYYLNFYLFRAADRSVRHDICSYCYFARSDSLSHDRADPARIDDPIRVREKLLGDAPDAVKEDVLRAYLNALIDACHTLTASGKSVEDEAFQRVRAMLDSQRDSLSCMRAKRQRTARLILRHPGLYRALYRFYRRYFYHNPYEAPHE